MRDDLGADVRLAAPATRVVSLVPSLTEALAATAPDRLAGATEWCTHPADLDVPRVRGTKNPDTRAIAALAPDLVVANREENRELDVRRLRDAGVPVWVTEIENVVELVAVGRVSCRARAGILGTEHGAVRAHDLEQELVERVRVEGHLSGDGHVEEAGLLRPSGAFDAME